MQLALCPPSTHREPSGEAALAASELLQLHNEGNAAAAEPQPPQLDGQHSEQVTALAVQTAAAALAAAATTAAQREQAETAAEAAERQQAEVAAEAEDVQLAGTDGVHAQPR